MRLDAAALAAFFLLVLWAMYARHRAEIKATRGAMFEPCLPLLSRYRLEQDDVNFPILTGVYRGYPIRVEPIADHAAYRKIPSLWLLVTVAKRLPVAGAFDLLVRPQNVEFFSPWSELPNNLPPPQGWPAHSVIKTQGTARIPWISLLTRHVETIFSDVRAKELLVTPRGVRVVYQLTQAERSQYLVLRSPVFRDCRLSEELFCRLLDWAIEVHVSVCEGIHALEVESREVGA
jgi:hypothetical protein